MFPSHVTSAWSGVLPPCPMIPQHCKCRGMKKWVCTHVPINVSTASQQTAPLTFPVTTIHPWIPFPQKIHEELCFSKFMQAWELSKGFLEGDGIYHQPALSAAMV